jgi:hypothetical protein
MVMADKHSGHKQRISFAICQLEHENSKICHGLFSGPDLVKIKWSLDRVQGLMRIEYCRSLLAKIQGIA